MTMSKKEKQIRYNLIDAVIDMINKNIDANAEFIDVTTDAIETFTYIAVRMSSKAADDIAATVSSKRSDSILKLAETDNLTSLIDGIKSGTIDCGEFQALINHDKIKSMVQERMNKRFNYSGTQEFPDGMRITYNKETVIEVIKNIYQASDLVAVLYFVIHMAKEPKNDGPSSPSSMLNWLMGGNENGTVWYADYPNHMPSRPKYGTC